VKPLLEAMLKAMTLMLFTAFWLYNQQMKHTRWAELYMAAGDGARSR
jgi:hypothetical protein